MKIDACMAYIHKTLWLGSKPGLSRTRELLERIGNPEKKLKFIHVVGTNGKGSSCAMLSLILSQSGYRVGTFVSPYIVHFNERIQMNGQPISDEDLCDVVEFVKPHADAMEDSPTEFELITAVGFEYFTRKGCDLVVLEAGMGGAMDSTNVIETPLVSLFTAIGMDHKNQLGETVEEIARTKAGILKKGTRAVFNGDEAAALPVLEEACGALNIPLTVPDRSALQIGKSDLTGSMFDYKDYKALRVALSGVHQVQNAIAVIEVVEALRARGIAVSEEALRYGLAEVRWPARFEVLRCEPLVIFDGAHNLNGVRRLRENVEWYFPGKKLVMLMGVMRDKDYNPMLDLMMPLCSRLYTVTPNNPRALPAVTLAELGAARGVPAEAIALTQEDVQGVLGKMEEDEVLLMMGSLYMYGDLVKLIE